VVKGGLILRVNEIHFTEYVSKYCYETPKSNETKLFFSLFTLPSEHRFPSLDAAATRYGAPPRKGSQPCPRRHEPPRDPHRRRDRRHPPEGSAASSGAHCNDSGCPHCHPNDGKLCASHEKPCALLLSGRKPSAIRAIQPDQGWELPRPVLYLQP